MRTHRIAELAPGAEATIAGRVLSAEGGGGHPPGRLRDGSGEVDFVGAAASDLRRGDLCTLRGALAAPGRFAVAAAERLHRPPADPFADPEFARLADPARAAAARDRAALAGAVRAFFGSRGFVEVETGQLVDEPGQEPYLEPIFVEGGARSLITSPELRLKRLLAAGFERVVELSHCFRSGLGERSDVHHNEFTMLEWYRAYEGTDALMRDVEELFAAGAERLGVSERPLWRGRTLDLRAPFERLTLSEAMQRYAGLDIEPLLDGDDAAFRRAAVRARIPRVRDGEAVESLLLRVLLERVEGQLGHPRPVFLCGYPARMAALARLEPADPRIAARFEVYAAGLELANAFSELTDPVEQRRRFERERALKAALGRAPGPWPEQFLRALEHGMPPAAGIALGLDRLLLLLTGRDRIDQTLLFPDPP